MATGLENLEIYSLAKELEAEVCSLVKKFPPEEKFGKSSQLKRSSASVADNIAESYGRYGFQEKIQFLILARGSAEEAKSQIERSKLVCNEDHKICELIKKYTVEIKMINGFIKYLRTKKENSLTI